MEKILDFQLICTIRYSKGNYFAIGFFLYFTEAFMVLRECDEKKEISGSSWAPVPKTELYDSFSFEATDNGVQQMLVGYFFKQDCFFDSFHIDNVKDYPDFFFEALDDAAWEYSGTDMAVVDMPPALVLNKDFIGMLSDVLRLKYKVTDLQILPV